MFSECVLAGNLLKSGNRTYIYIYVCLTEAEMGSQLNGPEVLLVFNISRYFQPGFHIFNEAKSILALSLFKQKISSSIL